MAQITRPLPSIRTELLLNVAVLAAAALLVAVASVVLFADFVDTRFGGMLLSALILADVAVFVAFGAYLLRRLILRPLEDAVAAAEAIAGGDLERRVPQGRTTEFDALSTSVNRMTDRLLDEQAQRIHVEKLASVGRLAAGVAHEIGNPLGAIHGYTHLLRARLRNDAAALEALEGLERESGRIDRIVRGLLDYARPRRPTPTAVDVNDAVRGTLSFLEDQGLFRRVQLQLDLDDAAPRVFAQRHELEQVFVNLLLNAVDAMSREGRIAVTTRAYPAGVLKRGFVRRAGDAPVTIVPRHPAARVQMWLDADRTSADVLKIIVADAGPGIRSDVVEKIFDPFFTTKEPGQGTGLGLAIVARVVENVGGTVWVEAAREGGAAFHLLLPIAARVGVQERQTTEVPHVSGVAP